MRSCGMVLVEDVEWHVADLRVDWSEGEPIAELRRLWEVYAPQLDAYVTRALDPTRRRATVCPATSSRPRGAAGYAPSLPIRRKRKIPPPTIAIRITASITSVSACSAVEASNIGVAPNA